MTSQPTVSQLSVRPADDSEARSPQVSQALLDELDALGRQYAIERAGAAMYQIECRFRDMLDALPAAIYTTDSEGRLTHFNPAAVQLSGRMPELGTDRWCVSWKLYYPDGTPMPHDKCPMAIALNEGRAVRGERAILERPDGTRIWFMPYPTPLHDAQGQVIGGINMLVDITERVTAEARIHSEVEALTKLNDLSSRLWNTRDLREGLDEMLAATTNLLGADFGNIQILDAQRNVLRIEAQCGFPNEFLEFFREVSAQDGSACGRALRSGERIIVEDVETDPDFTPMLHILRSAGCRAAQSTPLMGRHGRPLGMISTHFRAVHRPSVRDLHLLDLYARQCAAFIERCKSDEALRASEERYRQTLSLMPAAVYACNAAGVINYFNERAAQLWGRTPGMGDSDERFCGSDQMLLPDGTPLPHEQCPMAVALREGRSFRDAEVNIRQPNGMIVPVLVNIDPIRDEHGNVVGAINAFHDVSAIKQAEEALRRWEHIFQRAGWAVAVANAQDSMFKAVNPAFAAMHGYTVEELVGKPLALTIAPESLADFPRLVQVVHNKGDNVYESMHIRKDGTRFPCLTHATAFKDNTGKVLYRAATFQDLTSIRAAEQAVRESETRFRQLADAMPQIVWAARPDGYIDYYNERWYEYTGFRRGEFGQASWEPILHPDDVQRCVETYFGSIKAEKPYQIEYRFRDRQFGGHRWFLGRAMPIRDEAGRVTRWFGTCTDINDTKQAEQTTHFLADASAALAELTDYRSTLHKVASLAVPHFADWCAVDVQESDGSLHRLAVTHSDPAKVQLAHELFRRYPPRPDDLHGVMKAIRNGESDWAPRIPDSLLAELTQDEEHLRIIRQLGLKSYICTPLRSRSRTLGVLTFVTVESGRLYDDTDVTAAEDLAHRAVIAIENATLVGTLKEADRRKDEFLATLAHELRGPLAPLRNMLEIMKRTDCSGELIQQARDTMDRQLGQMARLVDDLLDVSRISQGKLELKRERVELSSVVDQAVEACRPLAECAKHEVTVTLPQEPICLDADAVRLAQVFGNLLSNACKYTEPGGKIWLMAARQDSDVVLKVKDNGVGIPPERLTSVFEMFSQVESSLERSQGGLGIGLTLVKRLVQMHNGTVEAFSGGRGQGSEFVVRLPILIEPPKPPESLPPSGNEQRTAGLRILIVDDNPDSAASLAMLLKITGHATATAHDGLEAVEVAEQFHPDAVLLDIGLPKLNGYEVCRRIREHSWGKDMLLVAVTGWGQDDDRRQSEEAGFNGHLVKPVDYAALTKLLANLPATRV